MSSQPAIAVLGCGPAGLIAAQTAKELGARVHVISQPKPSFIAGAQYLHTSVLGMTNEEPDGYIFVRKEGTREGYAKKVYGYPQAPVSWDNYHSTHYPAWNMQELYRRLWELWGHRVAPMDLTPSIARQAASQGVLGGAGDGWGGIRVDAVVSTVPLRALCSATHAPTPHAFLEQEVHILQRLATPDTGTESALGPNHIIYNGEHEPAWYRHSFIFGHEAFEWSAVGRKPPIDGVVTIAKPLATDCTCFEETTVPWLLAGRYGGWRKDSLVHDVPQRVTNFLDTLGVRV
jgi:hypothetical protein